MGERDDLTDLAFLVVGVVVIAALKRLWDTQIRPHAEQQLDAWGIHLSGQDWPVIAVIAVPVVLVFLALRHKVRANRQARKARRESEAAARELAAERGIEW